MISDMERIGDQATDIAEIAQFIQGRHEQTNETLHTMATAAISMVKEAVRSFVERTRPWPGRSSAMMTWWINCSW